MKLQNTVPHMVNETVKVQGTVYEINGEGVADVDNEEHALRLLADRSMWRRYVERSPVTPKVPEAPKPPVQTKAPETKPEDTTKPPQENGDEWPDPKTSMAVKQLHEIADAYQVEYDAKTTKKVLVDLIMKAMYE